MLLLSHAAVNASSNTIKKKKKNFSDFILSFSVINWRQKQFHLILYNVFQKTDISLDVLQLQLKAVTINYLAII